MSESKHTPGPWNAEPMTGRGAWVKGSSGEWAALSCGDTDTTAEANARLIAAAPELLEALNKIISRHSELVCSGDCGFWDVEDEEKMKLARSAIAKAEGRV
jgi:hypothetical protein